MSLRKRERERAEQTALERMRGRIVSGIHAGHVDTGHRLPSYRELSDELGLDLRAVGRIYAALEREGLVEIRGKTGVYVASQERIGGRVLAETARWTVDVLKQAWQRRIPLPEYPGFVERCIATARLRGACVESTQDQLVSLCAEVAEDFGVPTTPVHGDELLGLTNETAQTSAPAALRSADFIVSTVFHAAALRPIAAALGKPLLIIKLDQDMTESIERHLIDQELTVICVDPRFVERIRAVFERAHGERLRGVLVSNKDALARIDPSVPVLMTKAARRKLRRPDLFRPVLPPQQRAFSPQSSAELIEIILRLNLEAMRSGESG